MWQESCRTFRSADELPHLPLVFNISYKEKLSFLVRNNLTIRIFDVKIFMMTKNEQIKQTLIETSLRRKTQMLKVFELKVNCHHTSKDNFKKLSNLFREAKWIQNDVIASDDIFHYEYKEHRVIKNFDKDHNIVERNLTIQTGVHQNIIRHIQQNIVNLSK